MKRLTRMGLGMTWMLTVVLPPLTYGQSNPIEAQRLKQYEQQISELQNQLKELRTEVSKINRGATLYGQSDRLGFVNIYTDGDAEVYIGGQFVGNAPINQGLLPGTYSIEIVDPLSGKRDAKTVVIRTGSTVTIDQQPYGSAAYPYLR